jgi:hypothetical protein
MPTAPPTGPRLAAALAAAVLLPALAGAPTATASAPPAAGAPLPATAGVVAADVRQPAVREVPLRGLDAAVLAAAPEPGGHAEGTLTAQSAGSRTARLRPAVAAKVSVADPAALVAVAADAAFPQGSEIQVRVREKKGGWSRWIDLHVDPEHGPDPGTAEAGSARVGSDPLMTRDATAVQVRIDTPTGRVPAGTGLTLVHAPAAPSDARVGRMAQMATVGQPPIVTRAQWGADESWRRRAPIYTDSIRAGFIHHTASTSSYSAAQAAAQVRAIYAYHTKSLKHSDIDYNFVVDRFGRLYEGRAGGIDQPVLGGHTAGFNEHTFAVVALGNFDTFAPPDPDMAGIRDSIARLFAWKLGLSGVNPAATVQLVSAGYIKATRYPRGSVATISATSSHQTVNFTKCPGQHLQAQLPAIRELGAQYSDVVITAPSPTGSTVLAGATEPVTLTASANRAVTWTADILSPCSDAPVRTLAGSTAGPGPIALAWDLRDAAGAPVLPATYTVRVSGTAADGTPVATVTADLTIAPAPGGTWGPCANASRVVGETTAATSVLWGRIGAPAARTAVLTGPADAGPVALAAGLAAAPLARSLEAPLLVTGRDALAPEVAADLTARAATEVLVVGGPDVVSDATAGAVAALGIPVTRLAGATAAGTAAAVAARMAPGTPAVLVSPGGSPAHAVAGAALAAARRVPLLLADDAAIPAETAAALAGRPALTVAAGPGLADPTVAALGLPWDRLAGPDAPSASAAIAAAFPGAPESAMVLPETAGGWASAAVAAAAGAPVLLTTSPVLAPAVVDFLRARPTMRATTTPVGSGWLPDEVLGATSRVLLGLPWAPPGVEVGTSIPTATATRKVGSANAGPEPVRKGRKVTVVAKVTARFTDGAWRSVPDGVGFVAQFKASGTSKYRTVATGTTQAGKASTTATATRSGRWRIVVGSKASASDYVRVKK